MCNDPMLGVLVAVLEATELDRPFGSKFDTWKLLDIGQNWDSFDSLFVGSSWQVRVINVSSSIAKVPPLILFFGGPFYNCASKIPTLSQGF